MQTTFFKTVRESQYYKILEDYENSNIIHLNCIINPKPGEIYIISHDNLAKIRSPSDNYLWDNYSRNNNYKLFNRLCRTTYNFKYKIDKKQKVFSVTDEFIRVNNHLKNSRNLTSLVHYLGDDSKRHQYYDFQFHGNDNKKDRLFHSTNKDLKKVIKSETRESGLTNKKIYDKLKKTQTIKIDKNSAFGKFNESVPFMNNKSHLALSSSSFDNNSSLSVNSDRHSFQSLNLTSPYKKSPNDSPNENKNQSSYSPPKSRLISPILNNKKSSLSINSSLSVNSDLHSSQSQNFFTPPEKN